MRIFRWSWPRETLDAAGKDYVRGRLGEIDRELKQISTDVAAVSLFREGVLRMRRSGRGANVKPDPAE